MFLRPFITIQRSGIAVLLLLAAMQLLGVGCANIIPPSGGYKDTIPPRLVVALPRDSALRVTTTRINLGFDEYIDGKDLQANLIVSPIPAKSPLVDYKLRNINIRLQDSLEANTTYSLNFQNSLRDINEGNIYKNFTYVFSTGNHIDKGSFSGKVFLAATGKTDSTLIVILHRNLNDTAVRKSKPRYYTTIDGKGNFSFKFLAPGTYNAFVLKNGYNKRYDDSTAFFAFLDQPVTISDNLAPQDSFYAYQEALPKATPIGSAPANAPKPKEDKRLKYTITLETGRQELINDTLQFSFNHRITKLDTSAIVLYDTNYAVIPGYHFYLDTSLRKLSLVYHWKEDTHLRLLLKKTAVTDSAGTSLLRTDTIAFTVKRESDYGAIHIRFSHFDPALHPVLQLVQSDRLIESIPLHGRTFDRELYYPGDYDLRVLYDTNNNGVWDPGNYKLKKQPEIVRLLPVKLSVKANYGDATVEVTL